MTKQEKEKIMQKLVFGPGVVERTVNLHGINVKIRNILSAEQIVIEKEMETQQGTPAYLVHYFQARTLDHTLLQIGDKKFSSPEEVNEWRETSGSSALIDGLIKIQVQLEKDCASVTGFPEEEIEGFTEALESDKD